MGHTQHGQGQRDEGAPAKAREQEQPLLKQQPPWEKTGPRWSALRDAFLQESKTDKQTNLRRRNVYIYVCIYICNILKPSYIGSGKNHQ